MRVLGVGAALAALLTTGVAPVEAGARDAQVGSQADAEASATLAPPKGLPEPAPTLPVGKAARPDGPNPYLALLPETVTPKERAA